MADEGKKEVEQQHSVEREKDAGDDTPKSAGPSARVVQTTCPRLLIPNPSVLSCSLHTDKRHTQQTQSYIDTSSHTQAYARVITLSNAVNSSRCSA